MKKIKKISRRFTRMNADKKITGLVFGHLALDIWHWFLISSPRRGVCVILCVLWALFLN